MDFFAWNAKQDDQQPYFAAFLNFMAKGGIKMDGMNLLLYALHHVESFQCMADRTAQDLQDTKHCAVLVEEL